MCYNVVCGDVKPTSRTDTKTTAVMVMIHYCRIRKLTSHIPYYI